ncbi:MULTISPECIES: enhanced intracellular survival protein Eis [unclassified Bacillus (in: firmicutes)]|uniref:GNAT family N-acetyltransferase n=1 Tax=unclassified Bacillus (in: firmicutes) TaxID=185979 RepID=UPI0008E916EC|nr:MULTISPECIES: GNAT family N-acetyltransferase [unclassified Bacillus (in: firmicutes)]SFA76027.1 Predicted acetyltransferase [Bacillus sp. UNCCL13]SFQ65993.1 Predicted acetyltransferase [Bacillus sp. cl95]
MEIKRLNESDYVDSMKLSMYAFQYKIPDEDIESRKKMLDKHRLLGIREQNQLAAKLHIIPLTVVIGQEEWKMGGLAGVATYPEYRRNGYVRELVSASLKDMKDHGEIVSLLHPFDIGFYRRYGWEIFVDHKKVVITRDKLKMLPPSIGMVKRYNKNTHSSAIEEVYRKYSLGFNGMLVRDHDWWMNSIYHEESIAVHSNELGEMDGYILYTVKDKVMDVQEFVALNHMARRGLWNFICQHDSMVEKVQILLSTHDILPYCLHTPKLQAEVYPYFMARLVDVESCLNKFSFVNTGENLFIHLEDQYAPWNNGTYMISEDGVKVFKDKPGSACAHPPQKGISMDINSLTAIIFGYKRPMELYEIGRLTGNMKEIEHLEKMIPSSKSFFYDFF